MEEKEIDIDNEEEILQKLDFDYYYNSAHCSKEFCMFFNDLCFDKRNNYNIRQALIDLGRIAITLNQQDKRIKELEEINKKLDKLVFKNFSVYMRCSEKCTQLVEENKHLKQSQKRLAIGELKWILELIKYPNVYEHFKYHKTLSMFLNEKINKRIKELGGGENE